MLQFTISARCPKTGAKLSSVNVLDVSLAEAMALATDQFIVKLRRVNFTCYIDYAGTSRTPRKAKTFQNVIHHRAKELSLAA